MEDLKNIKQAIEKACSITRWNPTSAQLEKIVQLLVQSKVHSKNDVSAIVLSVYPNAEYLAAEGFDNSDLRTLIALAIQIAKAKAKG